MPQHEVGGRRGRSAHHDTRILAAAVAVLARDGWPNLNTRTVAGEAGMSYRPVLQRYPNRTAMALAAWRAVAPETLEALTNFFEATAASQTRAGEPQGGANPNAAEAGSWAANAAALTAPIPALAAAAELLAAAPYEPALAEAILHDLATTLRATHDATRASIALGLLLEGRAQAPNVHPVIANAHALIFVPPDGQPPPDFRSPAPRQPVLAPNDPAGEALLHATLVEVSVVGFHAATVMRIVERAGVTESLLFTRFPTKRACFDAAVQRKEAVEADGIARLHERLRRMGDPSLARALALREVMRPGRSYDRRLDLERLRLAWHDGEALAVGEARFDPVEPDGRAEDPAARAHACAVHGATLLALLLPDAWRWPIGTIRAT